MQTNKQTNKQMQTNKYKQTNKCIQTNAFKQTINQSSKQTIVTTLLPTHCMKMPSTINTLELFDDRFEVF